MEILSTASICFSNSFVVNFCSETCFSKVDLLRPYFLSVTMALCLFSYAFIDTLSVWFYDLYGPTVETYDKK